eukprot:CAMPEP_0113900022 /NCGR_PEP_ID=MMETSP0780_2-20120614/20416_1 /TAXON_ID=652834 /ORGANISM="Palpitomonas bilix" /LENGTH=548 /DNA_ID=CAMNT_0000892375 /DNA_START=94 /DNA_END=1740 /DNA_ORIENTATION=- /assembly_acc=CAM_ASM_000599
MWTRHLPLLLIVPALAWKVILFHGYHSTDFEVHRNWLAITHSLPLRQWYFENRSEWTLDYPPCFAYFEWGLSQIATRYDARMVEVDNLNYASKETVEFQRYTVLATEGIFYFISWFVIGHFSDQNSGQRTRLFALLVFSPLITIVDSIHFQYNGFLMGVLFAAILAAAKGWYAVCGVLFASLLSLKHLFLFAAPAFGIYLLRRACSFLRQGVVVKVKPFFTLAASVIVVAAASFLPFLLEGGVEQLIQMRTRLFPFGRGLYHAYWAPNVWAMYAAVDKAVGYALVYAGKGAGMVNASMLSAHTGGIVGASTAEGGSANFAVLPPITPLICILLVIIAVVPGVVAMWRRPTASRLVLALAQNLFASYMCAWHVHEKAIIPVILLLLVVSGKSTELNRFSFVLNIIGISSLHPLIFTQPESLFVPWMSFFYLAFFSFLLRRTIDEERVRQYTTVEGTERRAEKMGCSGFIIKLIVGLYLCVFPVLDVFTLLIVPNTPKLRALPFLPLLLRSTYTSIGMIASYLYLSYLCLVSPPASPSSHHPPPQKSKQE